MVTMDESLRGIDMKHCLRDTQAVIDSYISGLTGNHQAVVVPLLQFYVVKIVLVELELRNISVKIQFIPGQVEITFKMAVVKTGETGIEQVAGIHRHYRW